MGSSRRRPWFAEEMNLVGVQARERRATRRALSEDPVLIYQMGKVGSQTIIHTLSAIESFRRPLLHLHSLQPARLRAVISISRSARRATRHTTIPSGRITPHFAWRGLEVAKAIANDQHRQWTVITLVRDPVARDISAFFQNLTGVLGFDLRVRLGAASPEVIAEEIRPIFVRYFVDSAIDPVVNAGLSWFDDEMKTILDVDVYRVPFPRDLGHQTLQGQRARVLVIRVEDLSEIGVPALTEFLGHDILRLVHANVAADRAYRDVAQTFKGMALPSGYLDRSYGSKLARHFYSPIELEAFRARWKT